MGAVEHAGQDLQMDIVFVANAIAMVNDDALRSLATVSLFVRAVSRLRLGQVSTRDRFVRAIDIATAFDTTVTVFARHCVDIPPGTF